jgi:hypothetical protein
MSRSKLEKTNKLRLGFIESTRCDSNNPLNLRQSRLRNRNETLAKPTSLNPKTKINTIHDHRRGEVGTYTPYESRPGSRPRSTARRVRRGVCGFLEHLSAMRFPTSWTREAGDSLAWRRLRGPSRSLARTLSDFRERRDQWRSETR